MFNRTLLSAFGLLAFTACKTGVYYETGDEETGDTSSDSDTSDTSDSSDTSRPDTSVPPDTSPNLEPCHDADPVDVRTWTRTYTVVAEGNNGTEIQEGQGTSVTASGAGAYVFRSQMQAGTDSWDVRQYVSCTGGRQRLLEWDGTVAYGGQNYQVVSTPTAPRVTLPTVDELDTVGHTWTYSYNLNVAGSTVLLPPTITASGTYLVVGVDVIQVGSEWYEAWHIRNTFKQVITGTSIIPGGSGDSGELNAVSDMWYTADLGLVKEEMINTDTGDMRLSKQLTGFTGLSPQTTSAP